MESVKIDYKCTDGFKFEVTLNKTKILEEHDDFQERVFFLGKLPSHLDRLLIIVHIQWRNPPKVSENINFGNCTGLTNPSWTLLSDDSESIAISFLADDCGFIIETEPNIIYQSTLFIPNSGNCFHGESLVAMKCGGPPIKLFV